MTNLHLCDATLILTLAGQQQRQQDVSTALQSVGIESFEFFYGLTAGDAEVQQALGSGVVMRFPPCFRCGLEDCGDPGCNNILLPVQVAVVLSFRALFAHCLEQGFGTMAIGEDDIIFASYARTVFDSSGYAQSLEASGLFTDAPTLIRLGDSRRPDGFEEDGWNGDIHTHGAVTMSNYLFLCNRAFAALAYNRLAKIDHTADVLIHQALCDQATCLTLTPQLVCDRSWALRTSPSLIHPKPEYLDYLRRTSGEDSTAFIHEHERLLRHRKKAHSYHHVFVGLVNCDFGRVVRACRSLGLDIGVGAPAADGFTAWQYTTPAAIEYISDSRLGDTEFVHVGARYLVVAEPAVALLDLARRLETGDPDAELAANLACRAQCNSLRDTAVSALERAVNLYIDWHRLARAQPLKGIVLLDNIETTIEPILAGETVSWPSMDGGALDALTFNLTSDLVDELLDELTELGFKPQRQTPLDIREPAH